MGAFHFVNRFRDTIMQGRVIGCLLVILLCVGLSRALLREEEFLPTIHKEGKWFIFFSVPWCNSCQKVQKEWNKFSQSVHKDFHVEQVDCMKESGICRLADIEKFPSFRLYHEGKQYDYQDTERTPEGWKKFIREEFQQVQNPENMPSLHARIPSEDDFIRALEIIWDHAAENVLLAFAFVAFFSFTVDCCLGSIADACYYQCTRKP